MLTRACLRVLCSAHYARRLLRRRSSQNARARRNREAFYEHVWRDAAGQCGATTESLGYGVFEIERDGARTRVMQNWTALDHAMTLSVAGNKPIVCRLLADKGLPVAPFAEFSLASLRPAEDFLAASRGPCVVKPAAGTGGGQGVTTGVRAQRHLVQAAAAATVYGRNLLIESQIAGDSYRLLYLDGELLDAVVQSPPSIVGDGVASIRSLVKRANAERIAQGAGLGPKLIAVDPDMKNTLAGQGLKLSAVPSPGRTVRLKTAINDNGAWDNCSVAHRLSDSIIADGALAARTIGARLAGVDVVTPDPGVPLSESGGAIIEVNTTPGFYWHYHKRDGSTPVARPILERLLEDTRGNVLEPNVANVAVEDRCSTPLSTRA